MSLYLEVYEDCFPIDGVFRIARGARTEANVVTVHLSDGTHTGYGECVPYARYGESVPSVMEDLLALEVSLGMGISLDDLQQLMKPGAARNALDCAFWDLAAKQSGKRVWEIINQPAPKNIVTAYTISYDEPEVMRAKAAENAARPLLKVKLAGKEDLVRLQAVRKGAPDARIMLDANEGWTREIYEELIPELAALNIEAIEQPFPADDDACLLEVDRPIPIVADESCHTTATLDALKGKYDMINIKLDKTGGLTEALKLKHAALEAGFGIMVGCMVGSSLSMAPAMVVAHDAKIADLDGPLLLAEDRDIAIEYDGSKMALPDARLWG